jgi:ribonuclease HI
MRESEPPIFMALNERDRIESIIKNSVGTLINIEQVDEIWQCQVQIPRNVDSRLSVLKRSFPQMQVVGRDGPIVQLSIPLYKNRRPLAAPEAAPPSRPLAVPTSSAIEEVLERLAGLYEMIFGQPGEVLKVDAQHFRVVIPGDLTFPFRHPFLALQTAILPSVYLAAVYTERLGRSSRTTLYFSTRDERPKGDETGVTITIDASHRQNISSYAACYTMPGQPRAYLVGAVNGLDNNAAELLAFMEALAHLDTTAQNVTVFTDSMYVRDWAHGPGYEWIERAEARHIAVRVQQVPRQQNDAAHQLAYKFLSRLVTEAR